MSAWYENVADDVEEAAKALAGNWKHFGSFAWDRSSREAEGADESAIVYLSNRDSGCLDKSNEAHILEALEDFTTGETPDVRTESHNHWAVGHVDGIVIRCTRDGRATEAFKVLHALCLDLQGYPVLDEDDFSQRESDEADATWTNYAADEFRRELAALAPHHEALFDALPTAHLRTIWSAIAEKHLGGSEYESQDDGAHFSFWAVFGKRAGACAIDWPAVRTIILDIKADEHPMRLARKFDDARRAAETDGVK
jgi:hypothetical protein